MEESKKRSIVVPSILSFSPSNLIEVTDADEEVFELYSRLACASSKTGHQDRSKSKKKAPRGNNREEGEDQKWKVAQSDGLGFINSKSSKIQVRLEIKRPLGGESSRTSIAQKDRSITSWSKKRQAKSVERIDGCEEERTIEVELHQDLYSINHRKGDTGSLVWKASVDLAELMWYDYLYPKEDNSLLDLRRLKNDRSQILELGSGTGILSMLTHSIFDDTPKDSKKNNDDDQTTTWTLSDQFYLLSNISKNLSLNSIHHSVFNPTHLDRSKSKNHVQKPYSIKYSIEEIDWNLNFNLTHLKHLDLILSIDCLYNESLIKPLLQTIRKLTNQDHNQNDNDNSDNDSRRPDPTLVLIISQLRSDEVIRYFIDSWLELIPNWYLFRINSNFLRPDLNLNISNHNYAIWCGWEKIISI